MTELIPWIHDEMKRMKRDMDYLLSRCWPDIGADLLMGGFSGGISLEIIQTDEALTIKAMIPGVDPEDLELSVTDEKLTIKGCKKETSVEGSGYYQRVEKKLRSFCRSVPLPTRARIGEIKATLNNGILKIVVPKWKPRETRRIKVEIV
jgi:HSP20 family protein